MPNDLALWLNGEIVPADEASVGFDDHGVTVGDGVFETMVSFDGAAFGVTRHLERLERSAAGLGIEVPYGRAELTDAIEAVVGSLEGDSRIRLTVTAGQGPLGSGRAEGPATVYVAAAPFHGAAPEAAVIVVPWVRNERGATAGLKTTSYAENVRALAAAHQAGADEAIFANTIGNLCEGTGSNTFVVSDGVAITPPLESGCLAGVTRAVVIELVCPAAGVELVEEDLTIEDFVAADEAFLTSTTRDVQPITAIDGRTLDVGDTTARLQVAWRSLVATTPDP